MSKKYSASKFRFSWACNSLWPPGLPPAEDFLPWGPASGSIQGNKRELAREASMGEMEAGALFRTDLPPFLPHLFSVSHTARSPFSKSAGQLWWKDALVLRPSALTPTRAGIHGL